MNSFYTCRITRSATTILAGLFFMLTSMFAYSQSKDSGPAFHSQEKRYQQGGMFEGFAPSQEAKDKRNATSKTFLNDDGTHTAVSVGSPVHYETADGEFHDIDHSVKLSMQDQYEFENVTNTLKSYFPRSIQAGNGVLVKANFGDIRIGMDAELVYINPQGKETLLEKAMDAKPSMDRNKVVYGNFFSVVDNEYEIGNNTLKNNFILNSLPVMVAGKQGYLGISEMIELPAGWSISSDGERITGRKSVKGGLDLVSPSGSPEGHIPTPDIYEAANPGNSMNPDGGVPVSYIVEPVGTKYRIIMMVDLGWLNDSGRQFPVVADPTVTYTGQYGGWMNSCSGIVENVFYVFTSANYSGCYYRGWIRWNTASIPNGSVIQDVDARFYLNGAEVNTTSATISVREILGAPGPYGSFNAAAYNDFGDGVQYTSFAAGYGGNYYGFYDLGTSADARVQALLGADYFQVGMYNTSASWKRFSADLSELRVTYIACSALNGGSISGGGTVCVGGDPGSFGNSASASGGASPYSYQWQQQVGCSGGWSNISGANGTTYNPAGLSQTTCFRRQVTDGCNPGAAYSNTIVVTVVSDPSISISGGGTVCVGGNTTLSASGSGGTGSCSYQWQSGPSSSGPWTNVGSNSTSHNTGGLSSTTYFRCQRICTGAGCNTATSNVIAVSVTSDPSISISGGTTVCVGGGTTLSSSVSGGTGSCTYQWQSAPSTSGPWTNVGSNSSTYATGGLSGTTVYRCIRNCSGSGCNQAVSNTQTVTVVSDPSVSLSGSATICSGGSTTLTASTSGGVSCNFTWQRATSSSGPWTTVATTSSNSYNTGGLTSTQFYRVIRSCSGSGCSSPASNVITVTVVADPSISASGGGTICSGGSLTLSSSTSGGTGCSYQWQEATSSSGPWTNVGSNSSTHSTGTLTATRFYRVLRNCSGSGCNNATSNVVTVTVVPDPSVSISGGTTICTGGNRTLTASASGGTGSCTYQWQSAPSTSGPWTNVGSNSSSYNTGTLSSTTVYRVVYNCSGNNCAQAVSNTQTVTVVADPSISASGSGTVCTGGSTTLSASTSGGTGCSYQWQSASSSSGPWTNVGSNSSSHNTGALSSTTFFRVQRICSGSGCNTATSNVLTVTVVPDPSISASGGGTICSGGSLTLSSSTSGGTGCSYQWQEATSSSGPWTNVGSNSSTHSTGTLTATRFYRVLRNCSGSGCNNATSNVVTVTVVPDPSVSISGGTTICTGGNQTLTASASGGTGTCTYQWQSAPSTSGPWTNVGSNSSSYNTGALSSTTVYRVVYNCSGNNCAQAVSNTQTVTVVADPSISASGSGTVCTGGSTTLSASTSGGTGCSYQWQSASSSSGPWTNVGSNSSSHNTGALSSTTFFRVQRICSGSGCNTATSNVLTVTVVPDPTISASGGGTICSGGSLTLSSSTSGGTGCSYQWQEATSSSGPWTNVGSNSSTHSTGTLTATRFYRVLRNCSGSGCNNATSNVVTVTVVPDPSVSISGGATICTGGNQTLTASASGGTGTCTYQWQSAPSTSGPWTNVGSNSSSYNTGALSSTTVYRVIYSCTGNDCNQATSNTQTVTVVADPSISISGGGVFCPGDNFTLTASASGGTGTCSYQWQSASAPGGPWTNVGTNASTYNTGALTNTTYYRCQRICSGSGCGTATSNVVNAIRDNIAPNAICQNLTVQLNGSGNASITAAQVNNGSTDNCTISSLSVSPNSFTCSNVGNNTVTLTVTDNSNNASTCTATVNVQDNVAPNAVCQNITVQLNAAGNASITAAQVNNGSSDACGIQSLSVSPSTFNCSNVGNNSVTLTVTDVNNNVSTCNAVVNVQDNVPPTAICQNITVQLSAAGTASITASQINNGSSDACGIQGLSVSPSSFTCSNVGNNTVTLTVTDNNNNTSTCTATVNVQDNVPPVALCQNVTVQLNSGGNASITASQVNNGSSDACGIQSLSVSPSTFNCSNTGNNTVTLTVTDVNNNVSTCTATVLVQDNIPPTALCQNVTVQLDAGGNGSITPAQVDNGSNDNCGIASLSVSPNAFTCAEVGPNTVVLTVTDLSNNVSTCTATATVQDNVAPNALCQNTTVSLDNNGNGSITPADVDGGSNDACGIQSLSVSPNTFDCSNIGANTVTLTVTDVNNNVSTCTATVTVQDTTAPPPFTCPANVTLPAAFNNCAAQHVWMDPVVTDNCTQVIVTSTSTTASLTKFSNINFGLFPVGVNVVTVTATDGSNNTTTCTFTVTVVDNQAPVITGCPASTISVSNSPGQCGGQAFFGPITASDNCPGVTLTGSHFSGQLFPIGTTTVTYTAIDSANLSTTCTFDVSVSDNEAPNAVCQNITVQLNSGGNASITVNDVDGGTTDNCGLASVTASPLNFNCSNVGANTVTLTATDIHNNVSTCTATVTVQDITVPTAVCQNVTLQLDANGNATLSPGQVDGGSTDNCTVASSLSRSVSPSTFTCANVGANTVTLTITDAGNNSATCTAQVTVEDNIAPTAVCQNITVQLVSTAPVTITPSQIDGGSSDACGIASRTVSPNTFSCATPGNNTVTLTVTDVNNNVSTCSAVVSVQDSTPPVAACQNITVQLNASGNASITASAIDNGSSDACGTVSLSASPTSFDCSDVGNNTVTLTVTDGSNNTATCTATVTVQDNVAPSAVCQNATVQLDAFGNASVTASAINNGSSDACGIGNMSLSPGTFTCSNVGANAVTLTVTDVNNNSSTCTATVTVEDNVAPTASCQNVTVQLNASGNGSISTLAVNNNSSDNCGIASLSLSQTAFTCADVGNQTVTLTVTDVNGNTSTCTSTVSVEDNLAPNAVCQSVTVQLNGSGNASITASQIDGGSTDNCGVASISANQTSFTCANVGNNPVTLTVTDVNGNSSTCIASVTVQDNSAPTVSCQNISVYLNSFGTVSITPAAVGSANDNCTANTTLSLDISTFTCADVGPNTVTLTATDVNNNTSTCTAVVTVNDSFPPIAVCQDLTVQLNASGNGSITAAQVNSGSTDNCGISGLSVSQSAFACGDVGANTVTLTVTDVNSNTSTCTANITVEDNVAPNALCQDVTVQLDASGNGSTTAAAANNGSTDNCGIGSLSLSQTAFTCADVGQNLETLTVTDVNGNTSTCQTLINVVDNVAPNAICQNVTISLGSGGSASVTAAQINNGSNDNCGIAGLSVSPNSFTCANAGSNTVTLTVTDLSGNTSTCTGTVTINDSTPPSAICQNITVQLNASGNAAITAAQVNNGSSDNCAVTTISVSPSTFTCSDVGNNTVTLTVTDAGNNTSTCTAQVTVEDNVAPNAVCQNITVQLDANGQATIVPADVDGGSTDACGIAGLSLNNNSFGCSDLGANAVTLTVTDVNGNTSSCNATVTVQDNVAPVAVCQNITVQLDGFGNASISASQVNGGSTDNCGVNNIIVSPSTFTCSNVGANTVTLTVTDGQNNSSTCTAQVTVEDNVAPTALCQNVVVQLDASGNGSTTASAVNNGSSDACGIAGVSLSQTAFACADVGSNSVTLTVTDNNGNTASCNATVTVEDNVPPTAACQPVTVYLNASGNGSTTASAADNGSSDACGIGSLSLSQTAFNCTDVGANTETLTVTDVNGNTSTCTTTITVEDTVAPNAVCQNITISLNANGNASINTANINNGSTDACGIATLSLNTSTFGCSNVGANTVTLTVTDVNGNVGTCTSVVTVEDNTPPTALCQTVTVQLDASGNGSVTPADVDAGSSDACGLSNLVVSPNAFTCADVGQNLVTLTVTDNNGNSSSCQTIIAVQDTVAPNAVCQNVTLQLNGNGNASVTAADVDGGSTDACGIASLSVSPNTFNCSNVSNNTVTLTVTDVNGNVSSCTATVSILDTVPPVAVCQSATVQLDASGNGSITAADVDGGSSDNCGITGLSVSPNTFGCADVGTNTVTLTVTDVNNNTSTCTAQVTVEDNVAPNAVCQNVTVQLNGGGSGTITASDIDGGSSDACGIANLSVSPGSFTCADVGNNTATLTVTDVNGNVSTCTATVTVLDTIGATAVCQNITIQLDANGNASITAADVDGGSADNCSVAGLVVSPNAFTCAHVGPNTVTLTVTDVNNNVSTCTAIVTVEDTTAPIAVCQNISVQLDQNGQVSVSAADVDGGTSDACGIASLSVSPNSFTCADVGNNAVVLTATDNNGNSSNCTAFVNVSDSIIPDAICQSVVVYLNNQGLGIISPSDVDNGSYDNCGIASYELSRDTFNCGDISSITPSFGLLFSEYLEGTGNNKCLEIFNPTMNTVDLAADNYSVEFYLDGSFTPSVVIPLTGTIVSGGVFVLCDDDAIQPLLARADQTSSSPFFDGNDAIRLVKGTTVQDIFGSIGQNPGTAWTSGTKSTRDQTLVRNPIIVNGWLFNVPGFITLGSQWNTHPTDYYGNLGFHQLNNGFPNVLLTVTDVNGNTNSCNASVAVFDTIAPQAVCKNITVYLNNFGFATISDNDVNNASYDACGIHLLEASPKNFNCNNIGPNTVTLSVADVTLNYDTCYATVTVRDTISPVAICQNITVSLDANGSATITPGDVDNGSGDACGVDTLFLDRYNFGCGDIGSNPVLLTVVDVNNNSTSCSALVTIQDTIDPTAVCQNITVNLDVTGTVGISPADVDAGSSDACGIVSRSLDIAFFNCSNVGPNTVTLSVIDGNNNVSTCTATVTVQDLVPPVANCQNLTVQLDASGNASIVPANLNSGSSDACGISSMSLSASTFTCADVGSNTVTLTVTDVNNNVSTCTGTVTVVDNIAPTALCQDVTVYLNTNGQASITAQDVDNGSNDACGIASLNAAPTTFGCGDVNGSNAVILIVSDANGNTSQCVSNVTVFDTIAPAAVCQDITVQLNSIGSATITAQDVNGGSGDACSIGSIGVSQTSFNCSNVGVNPVVLTVTDDNNNVSTCIANVTVEDNIAPVALCRNVTVQLDAGGNASINTQDIDNGSSDNCGIAGLSLNQTAFACADIGQNTVTLTATDVNGNTSTCTANVTVQDVTAPVAVCQNITVQLGTGGNVSITPSDIDGGSSDNCGTVNLSASQTSFTCADVGSNLVVLTVSDGNGNSSFCFTNVRVEDTVPPVAACQNITVQLNTSGNASITAQDVNNGSSDNCGINSMSINLSSFSCANVGPNNVTLSVSDVNGNVSTCVSTVTVEDNVPPVALCQSVTVQLNGNGQATITPGNINSGSSDACGIASLSLSQTTFTCADVGPNNVTLTVTDVNNNSSTCTATVTVEENAAPVAVCQNLTIQLDGTGNASITPQDVDNGSADNCGTVSLALSQTTFSCAHVGQNVVTLTVTDLNNNVSTCQATITVEDTIAPVAACQNITVQLNGNGSATITAQDIDNGSGDNCGLTGLSLSQTSFGCADVGLNTVVLTATDANNNTSTCSGTVTVEDSTAPQAICQNVTVFLDNTGNATIVPGNLNGGSSDACGIANLSISQSAFTCADVGQNTVTLTVTDVNNNVSTCTGTVTVEDNTAPIAVCQNVTLFLDANGSVNISPADVNGGVSDACGIASSTVAPTSFGCGDVNGTNPVILTVTDVNNNTSQCIATATVLDTIAPVALCQNITVQLNVNGNATVSPQDVDAGSSDACSLQNLSLSTTSFSCADVGANTVTLTATDVNNNVSSCTATVTVEDNVLPVALCQNVTVFLDNTGNGSITPSDVDDGSNDACGIASRNVFPNAFTCAEIGNNTVILTVTDVNNNTTQCTAIATVIDSVAPVALCQDLTVYLDANGSVGITAQDVDNGSNDACGVASLSIDPSAFGCGDVAGTNPVLLTVTDVNNNVSNCISTVTVLDTVAPTAICQDITVQLDHLGSYVLAPDSVNNGSHDNCTVAALAVSPNTFGCADVGQNTVTLTVTDVNTNASTCTAQVTVEDNVAPVALCQDVTVQLDASGNGTVTAQEVDNGSNDACGIASLSLGGQTAFDCSDIGDSTIFVLLTVTDVNNNFSTCISNIAVEDTVPPVAICQDITVQLDASGNASITAQDIDNGSNDACGVASLSVSPDAFTCANVGANTVILTVTDVNSNVSTCSAIVTVEDTVPPVAVCQDITVALDASGNVSIAGQDVDNGSNDACGIASLSVSPDAFTCANVGPNAVVLTVTDLNNNMSTCSAVVTVIDTVAPVAVCQNITVQLDASGNTSITAQDVNGGSNDACGIVSLSVSPDAFTCANVGPNTVTLTVTDNNNNVSSCTAVVTVEDTVPPVAVCQNITVQLDASGNAAITGQDVNGGSNDACGISGLSVSPNAFTCAEVGPNTVTLTVTDNNNNLSTCTAVVTVEDNVPPVALCQNITINLPSSGTVTVNAQDIDNGSNDACGIAGLSLNPNVFDCSNQGVNPVTLTVTDVNNNVSTCNATVTVTVDQLVATASSPTVQCGYNVSCNGANDGSASVSVTGGCLPYSYLWSNGQTTATAVNLTAGTYSVTVTDQNNNTTTASVTLTEPAPLAANLLSPTFTGGTNISCNGANDGSIDLTVTGGADCQAYSYNWSGPGGFTAATEDLNNLEAGTYTVTITDANGCTTTANITLTEPTPLVANAYSGAQATICENFPVILGGSPTASGGVGGYTYQWTPVAGLGSDTVANPFAILTGTTTYYLTVTDANGCTATDSVVVNVIPEPVVTISQSLLPGNCQGASVVLTANVTGGSGVFTYQWDDQALSTTQSIVVTQNGQYTAVVFDSLGCEAKDTIIVNINAQALTSSYTIIGFQEVDISQSSTVLNGGIGVKQPGNRIRVRNNSFVTGASTFAMADVIQVQSGSAVTNQFPTASPVTVPDFLWNPFPSNNNVNVGNNQSVTLTDTVYGTINLGNNASVTFTQKDVYIQSLNTGNGATVSFSGCTFLRVRDEVDLGRSNNFNPDNHPVSVFEEEGGITTDRGSTINANMFTLGNLQALASGNSPSFLNGQFIGSLVTIRSNVTVNWNNNCDPSCTPSPNPLLANCNCTDNIRELEVSYSGANGATVIAFLDAARTDTLGIFANVQSGETLFVASAKDGEARFNATTIFSVNGGNNIAVPSSCGTISLGQVTGPFTTESWVDGDGQTCIPGAPSKVEEVVEEPSAQSASAAMDLERDLTLTAHPNPFREATTVRFTVPQDEHVEVRVFNVSGQEVAVLFDGNAMGNLAYDLEWRPENVTNGLYTVKLVTDSGAVLYKKLVLSR